MEIDKIPQWILALEPEDATFLKNFVLKSGSLKEIARLYEVSYPTVRLRLLYMMAGMCSRFRPEECWRIMLYYDKIAGRNDQKQDLWEVPEDGKNI